MPFPFKIVPLSHDTLFIPCGQVVEALHEIHWVELAQGTVDCSAQVIQGLEDMSLDLFLEGWERPVVTRREIR